MRRGMLRLFSASQPMHDGMQRPFKTAEAMHAMRSMVIIATTGLLAVATAAWAKVDTACSRFSETAITGIGTLTFMPEDASLRYETNGVERLDAVIVAPGILGAAQLTAPAINKIRFEAVRTTTAGQCGHMGRYKHVVRLVRATVISSNGTKLNH